MTAVADAPTIAVEAALDPFVEPREGWEDLDVAEDQDTAAFDALVADADRAEAEKMAAWLASVERRRAEVGAIHQEMIDVLETRLAVLRDRSAEIDAPLARRAEHIKGWLVAYALRERDRTKNHARPVKSVKLLHATVSTSERGGGWDVDVDEALPWLLAEKPDLVDFKPTVKVADAKLVPGWHVDEDTGVVMTGEGEIIPGIRVKSATVTARVVLIDDGGARRKEATR